MNVNSYFYLGFVCLFSITVNAKATNFSQKHPLIKNNSLSIPQLNQTVKIDGKLNDALWQSALKVSLDFETEPNENITPDVETTVYIAEDGNNLYVAFQSAEPDPSKIRAFYRDRDKVNEDDFVAITLDTFNDSTRAYQFYVNALGVQRDSIINSDNENDSWDAIWDSASEITKQGYNVEMAIPLQILSYPNIKQQNWGIGLLRVRPRDKRQKIQMKPQDRNNACSLCQLTKISGFVDSETTEKLLIIPSLTSNYEQKRAIVPQTNNGNDWQKSASNNEIGLDLEWGINVNSTLNLTYNPDFSHIEADSSQVTVNNQYALLYDEKRTFFLEGADYFDSPMRAIHTRSIADLDYGVKYTTKSNNHTLGLITGRDAVTNVVSPNQYHTASSIEQLSNYHVNSDSQALKNDFFISRYRYDLGGSSNIGAIATYRTTQSYKNMVIGTDAKYRVNDQDSITMQFLTSQTTLTTEQSTLTDNAYYLRYDHNQRDWYSFASYLSVGKDFRADLGFFNRFSHTKLVTGGGYIWYGEARDLFNRMILSGDWDMTKNDDGLKLEEELELYITLKGPMQSSLKFGGGLRDNVNSTTELNDSSSDYRLDTLYKEQFYRLDFEITPISGLYIDIALNLGDQIDYANNQLGDSKRAYLSIAYNLNRHLELNLDYAISTLDVSKQELFSTQIVNLKMNYLFDPKKSMRLTVQQSQVNRDPLLYQSSIVQTKTDKHALQLLFSYKFNPKTVFFAGYADAGFMDDEKSKLTRTERNLFMKFSYAL
jgi:hypothetical protein